MKKIVLLYLFIISFLSAAKLEKIVPTLPMLFYSLTSDCSLEAAAENAVLFTKKEKKNDLLLHRHISLKDRHETAHFIEQVLKEDRAQNRIPSRMQDQWFLEKHFEWVLWHPDKKGALEKRRSFPPGVKKRLEQEILLTKYTIFEVPGSYQKIEKFHYPLYQFIGKKVEPGFTKQQIINGALKSQREYKPLVWLSREGLEKALMQGTVIVLMPDKKKRYFAVDRHNGFLYNPKKVPHAQKRYWFFREVSGAERNAKYSHLSILKTENATFAGDLVAFGRGSFICLECSDSKKKKKYLFGFLNDAGGMFKDNQYQLDLFVGVSKNNEDFKRKNQKFPETAKAYFLKKKQIVL